MATSPKRLKNPKATKHLKDKSLLPAFSYADVLAYEHAIAFTVAKMMNADLLADTQNALVQALENGTPFSEFKKQMKPYLMAKGWWGEQIQTDPKDGQSKKVQLGSNRRLKIIYETNLSTAYAAGRWQKIQSNKRLLPYLQYMPSVSKDKRDEHKVYYGLVRAVDDPIWASIFPPNGFNCFLPETTIQGDLQACAIKSYKGEAIHITTHGGNVSRFTADHPILTQRGWVRADNIKIGDNVVSYGLPINRRFVMPWQIDNDKAVPTAKNLAYSFLADTFAFAGRATLQFNSDVINGKINIDVANGGLLLDVWTDRTQGIKQLMLIRGDDGRFVGLTDTDRTPSVCAVINDMMISQNSADVALGGVQSFCQSTLADVGAGVELQNLSFQFVINRPTNSPRLATLSLHTASRLFDVLPPQYTSLAHRSQDDALFTELSLNGLASDLGLFGYLVDTKTHMVTVNPVTDVGKLFFSGHVFDFQSSESIVSGDGIIAHNCKCWTKSLTQKEAQEIGISEPIPLKTDIHFSHNHDRLTALIRLGEEKHGDAFAKELADKLSLYMADYAKGQGVRVVDFGGIVARKAQVDRLKIELDGTVSLSEGVAGDEWQQYHNVILERYNPNKHKIKVAGQPADFAVIVDGISPSEWLTIDFMMTVSNDKEKVGMNAMLLHRKKGKKAWDNLKLNIQKHLEKSDIVPIDLRHLNAQNTVKLISFVLSLSKEQRQQIVFIKG